MTEVEDALEDILEIEDASAKQVEYESDIKMKEKQSAEDMRKKARRNPKTKR